MRFKLNVSLATVNRLRCCEQRFALNFYILTMCQHQYKYLSTIAPRAIQLFGSTSNICRPSRRLINGPLELYNRSRTKIKLATNSWCTLIPFFLLNFISPFREVGVKHNVCFFPNDKYDKYCSDKILYFLTIINCNRISILMRS